VLLAIPAAALLARAWVLHRRRERDSPWERLSYLMSLSVLAFFCCSIPNIVFEWSVYFMVFWPLLGLLVSLFAGAFACSTPPEEMFYLLAADFLLIIQCFRSLVAPN
jgi:hypothetical protein